MLERGSRWGRAGVALAAVLLAVLSACRPDESSRPRPGPTVDDAVVVASFDFPESVLLGEIYSVALEGAGIPVRRELGLGPRELLQPALQQGLVDVVPEYLGTALASVEPGADLERLQDHDVRDRLQRALLPWGLAPAEPAPAENQNGVVVSRSTAERLGLRAVSDLGLRAGDLRLGGPPECPRRRFCLEGLAQVYGLHFEAFVPLATESARLTALVEDVVDVAVMFTSDASLATLELVLLDDDRGLQPVENVVPVVSSAAAARHAHLAGTLNAVSARLTSENLRFLNWRIGPGGRSVAAEARGWLQRQGLVARSG